jgi:uncharacterized phiE125 gp8 family phage protein
VHKAVLVTGPSIEPITLAEVQTHLRVTGQDDYLNGLITTARKNIERYLNRAIITQEWKVYYDCWSDCLKIPYPVLQSVQSVKCYDISGTLQTLSAADYYWVVTTEDPGSIVRKYDAVWPDLQDGRPDAIEIAYTAGWVKTVSPAVDNVPDEIKHAMKLLITNWYEHRGDIVIGTVNKIPNYILDLIHTYKIYHF